LENNFDLLKEVHKFVKHSQDLYPYGISDKFFSTTAEPGIVEAAQLDLTLWGTENSQLAIVCQVLNSSKPYSCSAGMLLKAIIEKGLNKSIEEVAVYVSESAKVVVPTNLQHKFLIVMGCEVFSNLKIEEGLTVKRGVLFPYLNSKLLVSHSLEDICARPALKKEFWKDLQVLLMELDK